MATRESRHISGSGQTAKRRLRLAIFNCVSVQASERIHLGGALARFEKSIGEQNGARLQAKAPMLPPPPKPQKINRLLALFCLANNLLCAERECVKINSLQTDQSSGWRAAELEAKSASGTQQTSIGASRVEWNAESSQKAFARSLACLLSCRENRKTPKFFNSFERAIDLWKLSLAAS